MLLRLFLLTILIIFEIAIIAFVYEPQNDTIFSLYNLNRELFGGKIQPFILVFSCLFPILIWARREDIFPAWSISLKGYRWKLYLVVNTSVFLLFFLFTGFTSHFLTDNSMLSMLLNILWHCGLVVMLLTMMLAIAPFSFWIIFAKSFYLETFLALLASLFIIIIAAISQSTWNDLSEATFQLSYWFLTLYEGDVHINAANRQLAVNGFLIRIDPQCSGYEGIGLVIAFLSIYIFSFRKFLRFPNVFLLYVIGIPLIWVLNALRIALLASIGGHISPDIAISGFHSQAGWIMFLFVTVGLMLVSSQLRFFRVDLDESKAKDHNNENDAFNLALALLAPFLAFMAASIIVSAVSAKAGGEWLYVLKVIAIIAVLYVFRKTYARMIAPVSLLSIVAGLLVAIIWIYMDHDVERQSELQQWINKTSVWGFGLWLFLRIFGAVILVPIAEELAFRGYLHRAIAAKKFETVSYGHFTWAAFLFSTFLFAVMHSGRFVEAMIAGALFAIVMYRANRISDPVAAHMVANAVVAGWAIWSGQWSLL